jgi:aminoglycoside phosphotransferase (APT) family kinase protein
MKDPLMANAKTVIKKYDAATVAGVLHLEIPDLKVSSITIIETGWDHLVAAVSVEASEQSKTRSRKVNGDWIFRFPRTEGSIANLEREKRLLEYLKNHITLPIPQYHYSGTNTAFVGYRKIPGIHLDQQIYAGLDPAVRHALANTFALFFTQLHRAVSIKQALEWGYTYIIRPLEEIESNLLGSLPRDVSIMVQEAIAHTRTELSNEKNLVFCHQDVNGDNAAFDPATKQITGIFDFSDAGIGPYSLDFAELFNIDAELVQLTAKAYAQMNNVPNPLIGGAADYIVRRAIFILEARKKGNALDDANWLKGLSYFMPVWQDLFAHQSVLDIARM